MVNIWDYQFAKNVRITCKDGDVYEGPVAHVLDKEDTEEEEDCICLEMGTYVLGLYPSEIEKIEYLE